MWESIFFMNSCEMEGKAEEKSMSKQAPCSCIKEVCMEAMSSSKRLRRMERLRRKPCCLESTQGSSKASQQKRVALAISLLSVLTMLSGLVLFGV